VLLANDIRIIEEAIAGCADWEASKDRDYEQEQNDNPIQFDYAAVHYVVRCSAALVIDDIEIPVGTPCEVQVKTILQHAYSELTHDTIYKPNVDATPRMRRSAAKSMALIEATNDYFQHVVDQVASFVGPARNTTDELAAVYRERVGKEPELTRAEGLILDAYEIADIKAIKDRLTLLLSRKDYLPQRIAEKASIKLLFRQPSILLVYMLAAEQPTATKQKWPLTPNELRPIYTDLGMNFDSY
jgi:putative GTP pyrophosphokinase